MHGDERKWQHLSTSERYAAIPILEKLGWHQHELRIVKLIPVLTPYDLTEFPEFQYSGTMLLVPNHSHCEKAVPI